MDPKDFCYWLHGFSELVPDPPTKEQWKIITDHLDLVFKKETPFKGNSGSTVVIKNDYGLNNLIC